MEGELLADVQARVGEAMDGILANFKSGAKITVLVRHPGSPDQDFMMTSDAFDEMEAMLKRRRAALDRAAPEREP